MYKKIGFILLMLSFVVYASFFAPPQQPDTFALIQNLSTGKWEGINPIVIALFNLMGVWPMIYTCVILIESRGQKIWAWPFVGASFFVGAFAILPYLALRQSNSQFIGKKNWFIKLLDSRWTGIFISLIAISLLVFGLLNGNWTDFIQQWQTSRFIHVMSLDFCLLFLLFPTLVGDDLARRGVKDFSFLWIITLIPLLGALAYLCLRPPLPENAMAIAV